MKQEQFVRTDGSKGTSYSLEAGDEVVARFSKVGEKDNAFVNSEGKAVPVKNYFLGVTWGDQEITVKITEGQKKVLDKQGDLQGKTIVAEEYANDYGKQVGVRVK